MLERALKPVIFLLASLPVLLLLAGLSAWQGNH